MDVVALGLAKADAKKNYTRLREGKRRRVYPLPLIPAGLSNASTAKGLVKATGATAATVATGGTGYVVGDRITLAGGTFSYATVLQVTAVSAGVITGISITTPGVYTAGSQPANAVAQASTTGAGTGATFTITWLAAAASSVSLGTTKSATTSGAYRFLGIGPGAVTSGYYGNSAGNSVSCIWEWTTDAPQIDIKLIGLNTQFTLYVNGQRLDDVTMSTDASGAPYLYSVAFSTVAPRTFRLFAVNSAFGGVIIPAAASIWTPVEARRPLAWSLGDSYTFGTGAAALARAAINGMAELLGVDVLPDGVGGSGWTSTAATDPATRVNNRLIALTETPEFVFLDLGYNDAGGNMTTVATNFDATVAAVKAVLPKAQIIVFGPATPLGTTANLDTVRSTIQGRSSAAGLPFVDVVNWVNTNNKGIYTGGDNVHPNQAGHDYLAARRAQAVSTLL